MNKRNDIFHLLVQFGIKQTPNELSEAKSQLSVPGIICEYKILSPGAISFSLCFTPTLLPSDYTRA
jgi:hypothetical protein